MKPILFVAVMFIPNVLSQSLDPDDIYTFCGKGRSRGDNTACLGACETSQTLCSTETGVCACRTPVMKPESNIDYTCKPARSRTRCHNACKSFAMISPGFRRGEVKMCESRRENKRMCFCLSKY